MSTIVEISDHLAEGGVAKKGREAEGNQSASTEVSVEQKLAAALDTIVQLKKYLEILHLRLKEVERDRAIKTVLLHNVAIREQELYAQFAVKRARR